MYNGIGLRTARGSGTNGYVQRNLTFLKPKPQAQYKYDDPPPAPARKPSDAILLHRSKRQIEVECLELEEELRQSARHTPESIQERVDSFRKRKLIKLEERVRNTKAEVLVEEKGQEMKRIKEAFGIKDDFVEGRAFNFETEKQRGERMARIVEEERRQRAKNVRDL